jgi:hypothetical protein
MSGNDEIRRILLEILRVGLLRIRAYGSSGLGEACSWEADHLHNLPVLIRSVRREELLYYYNIERPAFLTHTTSNVDEFKLLWDELILNQAKGVTTILKPNGEIIVKDGAGNVVMHLVPGR